VSGTKRAVSTISCADEAARQGDPGFSRFYVSLEDDLMVRFGGDKLKKLFEKSRVMRKIESKTVNAFDRDGTETGSKAITTICVNSCWIMMMFCAVSVRSSMQQRNKILESKERSMKRFMTSLIRR
jgi:hypothetical protein